MIFQIQSTTDLPGSSVERVYERYMICRCARKIGESFTGSICFTTRLIEDMNLLVFDTNYVRYIGEHGISVNTVYRLFIAWLSLSQFIIFVFSIILSLFSKRQKREELIPVPIVSMSVHILIS